MIAIWFPVVTLATRIAVSVAGISFHVWIISTYVSHFLVQFICYLDGRG